MTSLLLGFILLTNNILPIFNFFSQISLHIWLLILLLTASAVVIMVVRIRLFLPKHKFKALLYVRLVSSAYALVLPGQLASEGVRAYMMGKDEQEYAQPGTAVMIDKLLGIVALLVLGIVGLIISEYSLPELVVAFALTSGMLFVILFSVTNSRLYDLFQKFMTALSKKRGYIGNIFVFLSRVLENWKIYSSNKKLLGKNLLYGILLQLFIALIGVLFTYGVGAGFYFFEWLWIHAMLTFVLLIPISLGGLGIREGSLIGFLGLIGIEPEKALAVSFGLLSTQLIQATVGIALKIFIALRNRPALK